MSGGDGSEPTVSAADQPSTPPLTPVDLGGLLDRIAHEWESRRRIFDLPTARFWKPDPAIDLGFDFLGRRCATPIGPAAGPHSQLAQNIVLSWLGGSRLIELKTVQVLDNLEIARPCIDMATVGYNIEWSQELTVAQSLTEYVKAAMLIEILRRWEPLSQLVGPDPGPCVFDMSVGYDLAGIRSPKVQGFINGMADASDEIEALRSQIQGPFAPYADLDVDPVISDTLTLSTFHGCPPDEIEAITKYLIDHHDLDVIVKLNPTLLGYDAVADIVNDQLGYREVSVKVEAFDEDLKFDRGIELIGELRDYAHDRGRRFGIKLTNTLVLNNHKGWMPDDTMYLSGPPLHVLASTLLDRLDVALPGVLDLPHNMAKIDGEPPLVMVSFSAGVNKANLADTLAMGVNPATVCSDLLKPGGYGRLAPMLKALTKAVADSGANDLTGYRAARQREAEGTSAAQHVANLGGPDRAAYHYDGNKKLPRAVDHELQMFGCVACNFCVTVCPNDAFFAVPSLEGMADRQQYLLFTELCNECGNCMTFCPEDGDPAMIKPRLYTEASVYNGRAGQGFLVAGGDIVESRADPADVELVRQLLRSPIGNPRGEGR